LGEEIDHALLEVRETVDPARALKQRSRRNLERLREINEIVHRGVAVARLRAADHHPGDINAFRVFLGVRSVVEIPTLNDAQREALQESQAELLWGGS
jgi:hypothetical protein